MPRYSSHPRIVFLALLLLLGIAACEQPSQPKPPTGTRILFVGNSLTYENDLPRTFADLAAQGGFTIHTSMVAFPNYSLDDHAQQGDAAAAIRSGTWTYVVLQQGPSALESSRQALISGARWFQPYARAAGARIVMYQVWPASANAGDFPRVAESYRLAAEAVGGVFAPAGAAWITAWASDATLALYGPDGFHPSVLGTYLAAAVLFERVTGADARTLPQTLKVAGVEHPEVPEATVRLLQSAAHETNAAYPQ